MKQKGKISLIFAEKILRRKNQDFPNLTYDKPKAARSEDT